MKDETGVLAVGTERTQLSARHYLLVFERELSSRVFPLPVSGTVLIGRGEEAELRLQDGSVSRRHASITRGDGEVVVADCESQNGTLVNGARITKPYTLVSGDTISIGEVTLIYHASIARSTAAEPALHEPEVRRLTIGERTVAIADPAMAQLYLSTAIPETPPEPTALAGMPQFRPLAEEIRELEQARIAAALSAANGNQRVAAELLQMPLRTFVFKLKQYGLRRVDEER